MSTLATQKGSSTGPSTLASSYVLAYPHPLASSLYLHFSTQGLCITSASNGDLQPLSLKDRNLDLLSPQEAAQKVSALGRENLAIVIKDKEAYVFPRLQGAMDTNDSLPRSLSEQEHLIREKDHYIQQLQERLKQEKYQRECDLLNQRKHHDRDLQIEALENELYALRDERQVAAEDLRLTYEERRPEVLPRSRVSSPFAGRQSPAGFSAPATQPRFSAQDFAQSSRQAQDTFPRTSSSRLSTSSQDAPQASVSPGKKRPSLTLENLPPLDQNTLLQRKLKNPTCELTLEESITLLTQCIQYGKWEAEKALGKNAVIFIGNTGAGKSTTVNYLCGCTMELKKPKELGLKGIKDLIIVKSKAHGGLLDEVMPIGHNIKDSKTFMPQIETHQNLTYCDCPGFLDSRGAEINIANAVNVKNALSQASRVTVVMLINYHTLLADRARGLTEMLKISCNLFGKAENLIKYKESILIGVTNYPLHMDLEQLKEWVAEDATSLMQTLAERIFIFDPLDRPLEGGWTREELLSQIRSLKPITGQAKIFSTVLTDEDETKLIRISEQISQRIEEALQVRNYTQAASHFHRLQELRLIEHLTIERLLTTTTQKILHHLHNEANTFRTHCHFERFSSAEEILLQLEDSVVHFNQEEIDQFATRNALRKYYQDSKAKHEEAQRKEEEYRRQIREAHIQIQQFLALLEEQKKTTEQKIFLQQQDFKKAMQEMEKAMQQTADDYRAMKLQLQQEMQTRLAQKAEELQTAQGENLSEIQKKINQERARLNADYQQKLQDLEKERLRVAQEQQALKDKAQKELETEKAELQQKLADLEKSKQEKLAEQERKKIEEAHLEEAQAVPPQAFGKKEWEKYFGDVGVEPKLPSNIHQILQSPCPIWPHKKVADTHLLTLIPQTVNGKPLTLNYLEKLIQSPKGGGYPTRYSFYYDGVKNAIGTKSLDRSYWVLLTNNVLPNTRYKRYQDQCRELENWKKKSPAFQSGGYRVPKVLEVATSVIMEHARSGKRFYSDSSGANRELTYTRCLETNTRGWQVLIGGLDAYGLGVHDHDSDSDHHGLGAVREV